MHSIHAVFSLDRAMLVFGRSQLYSLLCFCEYSCLYCLSIKGSRSLPHCHLCCFHCLYSCNRDFLNPISFLPKEFLHVSTRIFLRMCYRCPVQLIQTTPGFCSSPILIAATQAGEVSIALQHGWHCMQHDPCSSRILMTHLI